MAIQVNITNPALGGPAPTGYVRINSFYVLDNTVHVHIGIHASKEARESSQQPIWEGDYNAIVGTDLATFDSNDINVFHNLYEWLKTLQDFNSAIDIIEPITLTELLASDVAFDVP